MSNTQDSGETQEAGIDSGEKPWRDYEVMESLYEDYTYDEIAEELGTSPTTISSWMKRHGLSVEFPDVDLSQYSEPYYDNADLMERLYLEEEMSSSEIGAFLSCSGSTVLDRLEKFGIDKRSMSQAQMVAKGTAGHQPLRHSEEGYEVWNSPSGPGTNMVRVHRLLAVAEYGIDALEGMDVHHKNGVVWDNRAENIELQPWKKHRREAGMVLSWLDVLAAAEMYREGASTWDLAEALDVSQGAIIHRLNKFDGTLTRGKGGAA